MGLGRFLSCAFLISRIKYGKCKCRVCIWTSKWQKVCSVSTLLYFLIIFRKSLSSWGRKESDATECLNWTELTSLCSNYILYKNDFISYFMVIIRIQWGNICENDYYRDFPGGSDGQESVEMQETWVQSLGWEDPLEKRMATHFSILTWRIPWTEEPGRLHTVHGVTEPDTTEWLTLLLLGTGR